MRNKNPLQQIIDSFGICILDGAFATELERRGCDLNDPLWSARVLMENPGEVLAVHEEYFMAGADCAITASYQATFEAFAHRGIGEEKGAELMRLSISLASQARENCWKKLQSQDVSRLRPYPLVAASVGPYGAYLADGSEYRGDYGLSVEELMNFHRKRLHTLVQAKPDILACETIPCLSEAVAVAELVEEFSDAWCWISFSAKDELRTNYGDKLEDCARTLDKYERVAAVGINCTAPEFVDSLIGEIRKGTEKPVIVYPNSGEQYDGLAKQWLGEKEPFSFSDAAKKWHDSGAGIIGGCCRTTPADINNICRWARETSTL